MARAATRKSKKQRRRHKRGTRRSRRLRFNFKGGASANAQPLFQEAYAITLPEFPERFKRIKAFADAAGVPLQPFPGVKITPQERDKLPPLGVGTTHYKDRTGATFNLGVIGAFLAHRNLMEHVARRAAAPERGAAQGTLIFEDDVVIPPDFRQRLAAVQAEVPADWDILFLDKFRQEGQMISPHIMKLGRDMTAEKNWGIWAFIVRNASVAQKILPTMEHMLDVPDIQLNKFAHRINMYLVQPGLVKPDQKTATQSVVTQLDRQAAPAAATASLQAASASPPPLKVFIYANEQKPALDLLQASLRRGGYEVKLLGQGQPWKGFQERMRVYQAAAAAEPPDSLVAFLDGYDSLALLPASAAVAAFLGRPRAALPILFSAEPVCLANCDKAQLAWFDRNPTKLGSAASIRAALKPVPDRPTDKVSVIHSESVFLNGGAVMGRAGPLAVLYAAALQTGDSDDQRALGKLLAAASPQGSGAALQVDLDVEGRVFRTKVAAAAAKAADEGSATGPAFLHFPGMYGKEAELLQRMREYPSSQPLTS